MHPLRSLSGFCFFKQSFQAKRRLLKGVSYFFCFMIQENEILISVIRDSPFFLFVNRVTDPPPFMTLLSGIRSYFAHTSGLQLVQVAQGLARFCKLNFISLDVWRRLPYTMRSHFTFASQYLTSQHLYQFELINIRKTGRDPSELSGSSGNLGQETVLVIRSHEAG